MENGCGRSEPQRDHKYCEEVGTGSRPTFLIHTEVEGMGTLGAHKQP